MSDIFKRLEYYFEDYTTHWITIEGKSLLPSEMTTLHLNNCKNMMENCVDESLLKSIPIYNLIVNEIKNRKQR